MDKNKNNNNNSFEEDLEQPLLVEQSYTFDDQVGLKSLDSGPQSQYQSP